MKKFLRPEILFVFSIYLLNVQNTIAQTLTCQSTCPQAGEMFSMRTASPVLNATGVNQIWNFSSIAGVNPAAHLVTYASVATVPEFSLYPYATLVRLNQGQNEFLTNDNNGIRKTSPGLTVPNSNLMLLPFPFSYGNTYTETVTSTSVSGTDTFVSTWQTTITAVGSGTLILPSSTYSDVLSIKYKSTQSTTKNGSSFGYILYNTSYYYFTPTIKHYLLYTKQLSESGPTDYGPYTEFLDQIVLGIEDETLANNNEIQVFPNPVKDQLTINVSGNSKGKVSLKNVLGEQIIEQDFDGDTCTLNLAELPEGIYVVFFKGDKNASTKKIVVSR